MSYDCIINSCMLAISSLKVIINLPENMPTASKIATAIMLSILHQFSDLKILNEVLTSFFIFFLFQSVDNMRLNYFIALTPTNLINNRI